MLLLESERALRVNVGSGGFVDLVMRVRGWAGRSLKWAPGSQGGARGLVLASCLAKHTHQECLYSPRNNSVSCMG